MTKKSEDKPIVRFRGEPSFFEYRGQEGNLVAMVRACDHPVWGSQTVRTSLVVQKNEDGSFETLNTRYIPT